MPPPHRSSFPTHADTEARTRALAGRPPPLSQPMQADAVHSAAHSKSAPRPPSHPPAQPAP
eukprot:69969-Chlamydomonas_euryale.AAC.3